MHPILSKSSFFIFAIYTLLVLQVSTINFSKILHWDNPLILTIRYFTIPIFFVCIYVLIYSVMRKYIPMLLGLLIGNRW